MVSAEIGKDATTSTPSSDDSLVRDWTPLDVDVIIDATLVMHALYQLRCVKTRGITITLSGANMRYRTTRGRLVDSRQYTWTGTYEELLKVSTEVDILENDDHNLSMSIRIGPGEIGDDAIIGDDVLQSEAPEALCK